MKPRFIDRLAGRLGFVRRGPATARRNYAGAVTNRLTADWALTAISEDAAARNSLLTLRTRARALARDDDYARKFLSMVETNVVGPAGIGLQMDITERRAGKTGAVDLPDHVANDIIEAAWDEFSRAENFTVTGKLPRPQAEGLASRTLARDGEVLARLHRFDPKAAGAWNRFGFALEFLEADQLDHTYDVLRMDGGNTIRMGVELDPYRRPVAYHILTQNPADSYSYGAPMAKRVRVPAADILHFFIPQHLCQVRGISWFHTALTRMHMLAGYEEAVLVHARAAASKMGFIIPAADQVPKPYTGDSTEADGTPITESQPGAVEQLPAGSSFQTWDAREPNAEFANFRKAILRGIASGLGVSYNALASDLEGVNYSSLRSGAIEERDTWKTVQAAFVAGFVRPIFTEWLKMSLLSGAINLPAGKFDKFNSPKFIPRRWQWVDPLKDIQAAITAIDAKLTTHGDIIAEGGGDFADTMRAIERQREIAAAHGVDLTTKPVPPDKLAMQDGDEEKPTPKPPAK